MKYLVATLFPFAVIAVGVLVIICFVSVIIRTLAHIITELVSIPITGLVNFFDKYGY